MKPFYTSVSRGASTRGRPLEQGAKIVVIGNGMVGAKFCELLVHSGLNRKLEVTVVGEESVPAYNRINLSSYVDHRSVEKLLLKPANWYVENGIDLLTDVRAEAIDRSLKVVRLSTGRLVNYEALVLATGSRPFVPPIPGADLENVYVYRTIRDLDAIIEAAEGKRSAAIIGGGLLGLEAAQALQKLGLETSIIERANFLMPQQLNERAAAHLQRAVDDQGINVLLARTSTTIGTSRDGWLDLTFGTGFGIAVNLVVISAGITPNSELAAEAGLAVGLRGGVVVDNQLQTDDDRIFAIGECALREGRVYGLAAPGYAMAQHVVDRLAGKKMRPFPDPDLSARLKMLGVEAVMMGDPLQEGRRIEFERPGCYRMLILGARNRLVGGLGVGEWPEANMIQSLFLDGVPLRRKELENFTREGAIAPTDPGAEIVVSRLPDSRIICNCMRVTKGQIEACLTSCEGLPDRVAASTGASTVCGSCRPLVEQICGQPGVSRPAFAMRSLLVVSGLALVCVGATYLMPPMEMAQSVESWWYRVDMFWRDAIAKQITGYSLMAIFLLGLLMSLRKRFAWFRFGTFARWRFFHAVFGVTALVALFVHTGFHFGQNLNFWLMTTFVGLNLLGALAGVVSAMESAGASRAAMVARRFRPVLTYAHLVLFWPLPVLLAFHILSVYLY